MYIYYVPAVPDALVTFDMVTSRSRLRSVIVAPSNNGLPSAKYVNSSSTRTVRSNSSDEAMTNLKQIETYNILHDRKYSVTNVHLISVYVNTSLILFTFLILRSVQSVYVTTIVVTSWEAFSHITVTT